MNYRDCSCPAPMLVAEGSMIRCQMCGDYPREDLGGEDDVARLRYRVNLNRLREELEAAEIDPTTADREARVAYAQSLRSLGHYPSEIAEIMGCHLNTAKRYIGQDDYPAHLERNRRNGYKAKWDRENAEHRRAYAREYMRRYRARKKAA